MTEPTPPPSSAPRVSRKPADRGGAEQNHNRGEQENQAAAKTRRREQKMTLRGAPVTTTLIVALAAIELVLMLSPDLRWEAILNFAFGFVVQGGEVWATLGWPILTHAFLHGGLLHIVFNLAALAVFGPPVERSMGSVNYLILYLMAAIAGGLSFYFMELGTVWLGLSSQVSQAPLVGASGAISGVLAAELLRRSRILALYPVDQRRVSPGAYLRSSSITFLLINLALSLAPGLNLGGTTFFIAGESHIGGFLIGLALAPLLMRRLSD